MSGYRLPQGGLVDRQRPVSFTFGDEPISGFSGDTIASALLAQGIRVLATSVVHGRPRGVLSAGTEEPCAYVEIGDHASRELVPATTVEIHEGLRVAPGRGRIAMPDGPDPDRYDRKHVHANLVVVGAGPAGLAAAEAAGSRGLRVLLVEERPRVGGALLHGSRETVEGLDPRAWIEAASARLAAKPDVKVLTRTAALGLYDGNLVVALERRTDHLSPDERSRVPGRSRQRVWHIRARRVVMASGAVERPISFADCDRPGVMLAESVRAYLARYGVACGRRTVVFTSHDCGYEAALDLRAAGVEVALVADPRREGAQKAVGGLAELAGIPVRTASVVLGTLSDDGGVRAALIGAIDGGAVEEVHCDLIAVSGGWDPDASLLTHTTGQLGWDASIDAFVPTQLPSGVAVVGAAAGRFDLADCLDTGSAAGLAATQTAGARPRTQRSGSPIRPIASDQRARLRWVPPIGPGATSWDPSGDAAVEHHYVDLHRDVTVADLRRAVRVGLRSMEHVKRYTLLGTGPDQGRTANVLATAVTAELLGTTAGDLATPRSRPPTRPVMFAALAGRDRGMAYEPRRTTAIQDRHDLQGAVFEPVGQWLRPRYYPRETEDMEAAVLRECAAVRDRVGMADVSTLGKIDIQGPDAARFLDRIYTNTFSTLPVGGSRYGLMLGSDGMLFDDGVTTRLDRDHFHMTTTTGNAAAVMDWLEEWLQTEWPDLRVHCTSVTEQWAVVAVAGPRARDVLTGVSRDVDLSSEAFPFMAMRECVVAGIPARMFRVDSFSGELAFEVNVPWWHGAALWDAIAEAGRGHGITAYGTEAMHVLRAEKGYIIVGQETDGSVSPVDLGLSAMLSRSKDFIGRRSLVRDDLVRPDRKQLVGLMPLDQEALVAEGSQLVAEADVGLAPPVPMQGHVTASYRSHALGRTFALALLRAGRDRHGEIVHAVHLETATPARVTSPVFYDPENRRRDG